jgi:hypothetical protein
VADSRRHDHSAGLQISKGDRHDPRTSSRYCESLVRRPPSADARARDRRACRDADPCLGGIPGPNGRIAFASTPQTSAATTQGAGRRDIYTINPDGSGLFNLTKTIAEPRFNIEPDWSPDGTTVAFRNGRAAQVRSTP